MSGHVYFIRDTGTEYVKIGFTRGDPKTRMKELQVGCAHELEFLGSYCDAERDLERAYHLVFNSARVRGEWFWPYPVLMEMIGRRDLGRYACPHDNLLPFQGDRSWAVGPGAWIDLRRTIMPPKRFHNA